MSWRRLVAACGVVGVCAYVGVFSWWWLRSPSRVVVLNGRQVRVVEFQFNWVSTRTEVVWTPAFWFMESVCGYREQGYIAMFDESRRVYAK
jgi:hypothetical protein